MGYKYNGSRIKCPYFRRVIRTRKGQFIGIECDPMQDDIGFDVGQVVRVRTSGDLKDYTELFCKDCFEGCPYYKIHGK